MLIRINLTFQFSVQELTVPFFCITFGTCSTVTFWILAFTSVKLLWQDSITTDNMTLSMIRLTWLTGTAGKELHWQLKVWYTHIVVERTRGSKAPVYHMNICWNLGHCQNPMYSFNQVLWVSKKREVAGDISIQRQKVGSLITRRDCIHSI